MTGRARALDIRNKVPFMFVVRSLLDFLVHLNISSTLRYTPQILRLGWRLLVGKLVVASIDVTKACNLRCPYCYELPYLVTLSKGDGYTAEDIRHLVRHLFEVHGIVFIVAIGGEPTLYRDRLQAIADECRKRWTWFWMVSNLLPNSADPDFDPFSAFENGYVIASVDGIRDVHDDSRKRKGLYEIVERRLFAAADAGRTILTTTTMHTGNLNQIEPILRRFKGRGILSTLEFATPINQAANPEFHVIGELREAAIESFFALKMKWGAQLNVSPLMLDLMRTRNVRIWGGPKNCPSVRYAISVTTGGVRKLPCVLAGGAELVPSCSNCGCHVPTLFLGALRFDILTLITAFWFLRRGRKVSTKAKPILATV